VAPELERPRSPWQTWAAMAVMVLGSAACRCAGAAAPQPRKPVGSAAASASPVAAPTAPSPDECETLWARYHALVPDDPFVTHAELVARCVRSERAVLGCLERVRAELGEIARGSRDASDAGADAPSEARMVEAVLRVAMPGRTGICMTRERLRFALRSGELEALGQRAAAGGLAAGEHGVAAVTGDAATLPWRGSVELERSWEIGPPGEIRVARRPDGRAWLYFLGGLLGRHQNQVGFLYSSGPFVAQDFAPDGEGHEQICLEPGEPVGAGQGRYMLSCFTIIERSSSQLLEVGSAPD
jgi:hypothetical protein